MKLVFYSFEDKLFDRVIGTSFCRGRSLIGNFFVQDLGLLSSGALLLEGYGTVLIEVAAMNGNDFYF